MKFNLIFASIALSAVMAVPSQMTPGNQAELTPLVPKEPIEIEEFNDNRGEKKAAAPAPAASKKSIIGAKIKGKVDTKKLKANAKEALGAENIIGFFERGDIPFKLPFPTDGLRALILKIVAEAKLSLVAHIGKQATYDIKNRSLAIKNIAKDIGDFLAQRPQRIPYYTDECMKIFADHPDILKLAQFFLEFMIGINETDAVKVNQLIFTTISKSKPSVGKQISDAADKLNTLLLFPGPTYKIFKGFLV